ncbi:MAG: FAD-dependent oxidoreductase [Solirubrobacteraceae bacterium]
MSEPAVCVVGAGTAGLEALLRARDLLPSGVSLTLIAPEHEFRYRPMNTESLYRPAQERSLRIAEIVAETEATWIQGRVAAVRPEERALLTGDGDTLKFDHLLLALGASSRRALLQGYVWERGQDPTFLDEILHDVVAGATRSVAVVVPRGARWPVPGYELALVLGWTAADTPARVTLITAERRPLGSLGREATNTVMRELDRAGVELISGVEAIDAPDASSGRVAILPEADEDTDALLGRPSDAARIRFGDTTIRDFDRLISLPTTSGPFLPGIRTDANGFIEVDQHLKVCGRARIWAAGACISAALEHAALSAQQADAAVAAISASIGATAAPGATATDSAPDLTGMLLTDQREQWQAENPIGTHQPSTRCLWWPPGRAVGRMLAGRIEAWDPSVEHALGASATGLVIRAPVALGCSEQATTHAPSEVTADVRAARLRDVENRQLMAVERRERDADAELRALEARLEAMNADQQKLMRELRQHGYLRASNR